MSKAMTVEQTTEPRLLDPAQFRAQFPMLADSVHLASCSQGALSTQLAQALGEFTDSIAEHGVPWAIWMERVARARAAFAEHIGAHPDEVAIVPSASEGAYQVASTQEWSKRPGLVTTEMEFPSVAHVWLAQQARGAEIRYAQERDGVVPVEEYLAQIDETVGLVSVPLISYRNGARLPVQEAVAAARAAGARVVIDAYQAAGVEPIDVAELDCDYLVAGALKYLLGVPGIAFLYVRAGVVDAVDPQLTGWFGRVDPFAFDPRGLDRPGHARRFEVGTSAVPAAYGAVAGLELLADVDLGRTRTHVAELTARLHDELTAAGERIYSPAQAALRGPQVAIYDDDPEALAGVLAEQRIFTSPRGAVLRMSFHHYSDHSDIDAVLRALRRHRGHPS